MGTAIHDVLILDAQQVALGDHDIDVPHQTGDAVQVQTVLQLHLCEGVAAGMRADPHRRRDPHLFCGVFQYPCHGFIGHRLACFAGEEILIASRVLLQVAIPERSVLDELLGECGRFWHDPFLAALAMLDQNIVLLDVLRFHQDHFVAAHPGIKQQHDDGLVPYLQKILAIVELDHPLHLSRCKGIDNRPGLTEALYLFGRIVPLLQIALIDQIVEPCAPHLEQVVDIAGRAARVLLLLHQVPDVAGTDVFQLSDLLQLQIFQQKTGRSLIIAQGAFSQMAAFTVIDKFIAEVFQTHKKKHPFLHGGPQKKG